MHVKIVLVKVAENDLTYDICLKRFSLNTRLDAEKFEKLSAGFEVGCLTVSDAPLARHLVRLPHSESDANILLPNVCFCKNSPTVVITRS